MNWNIRNDAPVYTQLVDQIARAIILGQFPPGGRLPSVREFAADAGVNPNTMQRALSQLEANGLVTTNRTAGRVVTEDERALETVREHLAQERIAQYFAGMAKIGYDEQAAAALLAQRKERE